MEGIVAYVTVVLIIVMIPGSYLLDQAIRDKVAKDRADFAARQAEELRELKADQQLDSVY